jgi:hypothetical protein
MIYKLYKEKFTSRPADKDMKQVYKGFQEIYEKYGVKVIGAWENIDDPLDAYLITAYRDNAHYEETVAKMRDDPNYKELTKKFTEMDTGRSVEVVTLKLLAGSPE